MNRLLGKLFADLPKEMCWESAISEQAGDLASPAARTFKRCQQKSLSKPKTPNPDLGKHDSTPELPSRGLDYCASQMNATAVNSIKKYDSYFKKSKKQDDYERWLSKGRVSVSKDPWASKPSTPLVLHRETSSVHLTNTTPSDPSTSYLPPRVIANPEIVLRPPLRENLVSISDRTPPSMQSWAQVLENGEENDWLKEIDMVQGNEDADADIKALQKSLAKEKVDMREPTARDLKKGGPKLIAEAAEPKKIRKIEEPVTFELNNPLQRCIAYRVRMSRQRAQKLEAAPNVPSKHLKVSRSSSELSPTRNKTKNSEDSTIKYKRPASTSIGKRLSAAQTSNAGHYRDQIDDIHLSFQKTCPSPPQPPPKPSFFSRNKPPKRVTHSSTPTPPADPSNNSFALNKPVTIEHPLPKIKCTSKTLRHSNSFCQEFVSRKKNESPPCGETQDSGAFSELNNGLREFETNEKNLEIFREMMHSEEEWLLSRKYSASVGSLAELSERHMYHEQ